MENKIYRFDFVTDPDDPSVISDLDHLLSLVTDEIKENYLDRGLVRYSFFISHDHKDHDIIEELIGNISYVPITVTMDTSLFENYENIGQVISSASEIVKLLTEKIIKTDVINVESVQ